MQNLRQMHDLIFRLYAAFRYFVIDDDNDTPERKNNDDDNDTRKRKSRGPNKGISEIARFTGGNQTTLYRWEQNLLKKKPPKIHARVSQMKAKIEKHLENEGKSPEEFRKELQIACGIIQLCNNTASVRVLWELTEKEVNAKIQKAIKDPAEWELTEKEEVNAKIQKAIEAAADIVKLKEEPHLLKTQLLQRMKSIETTQ